MVLGAGKQKPGSFREMWEDELLSLAGLSSFLEASSAADGLCRIPSHHAQTAEAGPGLPLSVDFMSVKHP